MWLASGAALNVPRRVLQDDRVEKRRSRGVNVQQAGILSTRTGEKAVCAAFDGTAELLLEGSADRVAMAGALRHKIEGRT